MELLIFDIPMVLVWLLLVRPQQKRMRDQQSLTQRAGIGDVVITAGGFIVTIMDEHDPDDASNGLAADEVLVAMSDDVEVVMLRRSIAQIRERWDGQYADGSFAEQSPQDAESEEFDSGAADAADDSADRD